MTSSSDAKAATAAVAFAARASGVRAPSPVRVIDRTPPPPPAPTIDAAPLARALETGFAAMRAQLSTALVEVEKECIELAVAVAERVVRRKVEKGELDLEGPLRELLAARRRELAELPAKLRLHPEDAKAVAPRATELAPAGARIEVVPDPTQPRGDLALEIGASRLVRTLAHELKRLRERLLAGASS